MLLIVSEWLEQYLRAFNVFSYITLRAVLGTMTALVISFVVGPRMISWLTRMKIGQSVRDDGPQTHLAKAGTPTMGGALILVSIVITTLLWGNLTNRFVWVVLLVTLGFAAVYLAFSIAAPSTAKFIEMMMAWTTSGVGLTLPPRADLILPFIKT